jgi:membrane protein YqaA with SNARE-associated domain
VNALATLGSLAGGLGLGLGSALVPVVNAEAYVVLVSTRSPAHVLLCLTVLGVALGQTAGKVLLFESGRHARLPAWLSRRPRRTTPKRTRTGECFGNLLRRPRTGVPLVFASATVGLPPLAVISVLAGASGQRRTTFGLLCFAGRLVRFAALAAPLGLS